MKIHAIICTRSKNITSVTENLTSKLSRLPAKVSLMVDQDSIFSGYKKAFDKADPKDKDIFVLCHDDIEIKEEPKDILKAINLANAEGHGFVGVAGTKLLDKDAVWWNQERWAKGLHSGKVYHVNKEGVPYPTEYGPRNKVVVLDGLFLAASAKTLREVELSKPSYLKRDWDFYDLHYTMTAHKLGLINMTIPLTITHHSSGELVGREGWNENRLAFIEEHDLPIGI